MRLFDKPWLRQAAALVRDAPALQLLLDAVQQSASACAAASPPDAHRSTVLAGGMHLLRALAAERQESREDVMGAWRADACQSAPGTAVLTPRLQSASRCP